MKTILNKDMSFLEASGSGLKSTQLSSPDLSRRKFIQVSGATGAGFSLASFMPTNTLHAAESDSAEVSGGLDHLELNAFVEVNANGSIRLYAHTPE